MIQVDDIIKICSNEMVGGYIFVNEQGETISHRIDKPEIKSKFVFQCCKNANFLSGNRFKYLEINRFSRETFYIFPIGKNSLGVAKHHYVNDERFVVHMVRSLNRLLQKS